MNKPDENTAGPAQAHKPDKGISAVTYGLGESVKTGLWGLLGIGAAVTLLVRYGKGKVPGVEAVAKIPHAIGEFFEKKMGGKAGEWGSAAAVGFSVGTVASWVTHIPGLISGIMKVKEHKKMEQAQAEDNVRLSKTTVLQAEEIAQLRQRLDNIERPDPLAGRDLQAAQSR